MRREELAIGGRWWKPNRDTRTPEVDTGFEEFMENEPESQLQQARVEFHQAA